jgi:predicted Zn-dependent peptidase
MEMALNETYDLGQDFGNRYVEEIEKIDAEKVMKIARKYILQDHYVIVLVGAK